jgi:TPP-dependent pyruvate/acetoin dehydrogenase alpha subunit
VIRPYSHSLSDDERFYKTESMRSEEALRDPLVRAAQLLRERHGVTEEELEALDAEVKEEVNAAADEALESPQPDPPRRCSTSSRRTSTPRRSSSTPRTTRASRATRPPWWISSTARCGRDAA